MIINPYIYGVATSYDADAQLFFNAQAAAGVTLTTTQMNAVNQWVIDAKAIGIWTKMKAVYPIVGGTATAHKFNLKNPLDTDAAFRLSFIGGWTHSSTGALPNGTNAYADTFLIPTTALTNNNTHISFYSRTNSSGLYFDIGSGQATGQYFDLALNISGNIYSDQYNNSTGRITTANANSQGFYISSRSASNVFKLFKNAAQLGTTNVNASSGFASITSSFYLSALHEGGGNLYFSNRQCAFASIGDGLTDLESQLFYQITEKYQVALSRNINTTQSFYYNSAYNNETNAFLFSTQITDNTIQTATNTLVNDLKTGGVFTKMKVLYPMVGGTSTTHKFNLINAQDTNEAFRLAFAGGVTHSSNGVLFNGTNGWADSFMNMSTNFTAYDIHLSANINSDFVGTLAQNHIGANAGSTSCNRLGAISSTVETSLFGGTSVSNYGVQTTVTPTTHKGFWCGSRLSSTSFNLINPTGTITANTSNAPSAQPNLTLGLGCRRGATNDYYSGFGYSFFSAGVGLTTTELAAFKTAVNNFNTTLGRI